ncbi:MAG: hypothetical protein LBV08_10950, partial [Clostridiales bacterium]|nr:hypothetical protein [Clostridiales bacterium]
VSLRKSTIITEGGGIPLQEASTTITNMPGWVLQSIIIFLLFNIPTIILAAIYFACRGKHRRRKSLEKMNIQDLQ